MSIQRRISVTPDNYCIIRDNCNESHYGYLDIDFCPVEGYYFKKDAPGLVYLTEDGKVRVYGWENQSGTEYSGLEPEDETKFTALFNSGLIWGTALLDEERRLHGWEWHPGNNHGRTIHHYTGDEGCIDAGSGGHYTWGINDSRKVFIHNLEELWSGSSRNEVLFPQPFERISIVGEKIVGATAEGTLYITTYEELMDNEGDDYYRPSLRWDPQVGIEVSTGLDILSLHQQGERIIISTTEGVYRVDNGVVRYVLPPVEAVTSCSTRSMALMYGGGIRFF